MKLFCTLFLPFIYFSVHCQPSIHGSISDSTKTAIPFCAVGLVNAKDSAIVKGSLTDENGNFIFESIAAGNYRLKINHVGFIETWSEPFLFDSISNKNLDPAILKTGSINLKEVGIVTIKDPIEFKNGNVIVNIDGSPLAIGNSVYDLLSKLPGVSVDGESISIQGKSGARIYIDDRPQLISGAQLINLLKSLNSSVVEKIEVISNPPAKYDANIAAGIINIKTKKIKLVGFSGSVNLTYSQGFFETTNGGFSLNYKGKGYTVFSSLNANQGVKHNVSTMNKSVTYNGQTTQFNQRMTDDYDNQNFILDLGMDIYLNKKNIIGFKVQGMPGYGVNKDKSITTLSDNSPGYDHLYTEKNMANNWFMANYNLNAEHLFDTVGTKIKFSADYYNPNFDNYKSTFKNNFQDLTLNNSLPTRDFNTNSNLNLKIFISRLDFEKKLSKTLSMDAGLKATYQDALNVYDLSRKDPQSTLFVTDSSLTNKFRYIEKVSAAYLNFSKEIKKVNLQLGVRAENTIMQTENTNSELNYTRSYLNLFPILSMTYNRSKDHIFTLTYNKGIERPESQNLNPYKSFTDLLNSYEGNPYTRPAYRRHLSLNYALKSSIYNSISYTHYQRPISGYMTQNDSTKENIWRITNLDYFNVIRYNFFIRKEIKKWWVLSFQFGAYYVGYSGKLNGQQYSLSAVPHYEWLNNMFILPKDYKIEITGYYWGPWLGIANRFKARGALSIALKKSFLDNKLSCSVGINDIFFTEVYETYANYQNQNWQSYNSSDTRRLNINVSYNFGKIKVEKRAISTDDDKKGLSK